MRYSTPDSSRLDSLHVPAQPCVCVCAVGRVPARASYLLSSLSSRIVVTRDGRPSPRGRKIKSPRTVIAQSEREREVEEEDERVKGTLSR